MKIIKLSALVLALSATAHAQQGNTQRNNNGLLALPPGISQLIAVDAHNSLLAETDGESGVPRQFFGITVRHVYAGGIARLFGGAVVPTAPFVSPYFNGGNNGFNNNGAGNGNAGGAVNGNGAGNGNLGFNGGNNNFGNNGFNNNSFNGGNTFNNVNGRR